MRTSQPNIQLPATPEAEQNNNSTFTLPSFFQNIANSIFGNNSGNANSQNTTSLGSLPGLFKSVENIGTTVKETASKVSEGVKNLKETATTSLSQFNNGVNNFQQGFNELKKAFNIFPEDFMENMKKNIITPAFDFFSKHPIISLVGLAALGAFCPSILSLGLIAGVAYFAFNALKGIGESIEKIISPIITNITEFCSNINKMFSPTVTPSQENREASHFSSVEM